MANRYYCIMKNLLGVFLLLAYQFSAAQNWVGNYGGQPLGAKCWQLTPDTPNRAGSVWNVSKMDLNQNFDKTYYVYLGNKDGADGISFTMHNSPAGLATWGLLGSYLGYGNISPALHVEVDTYDNSGNGYPDIAADHISILRDGSVLNVVSPPVPASNSSRDIEDGRCHKFRIQWEPTSFSLKVFFDDTLRITRVFNIRDSIFSGISQVYYGFTGGTGGVSNYQTFCEKFADAGQDVTICPGDSVQLNGGSGTTYLWSPPAGLSCTTCPNPKAFPFSSRNYILRVTSPTGCVDSDTIRVNVAAGPTTNAGPDITLCTGDSIRLNVTGATWVQWGSSTYLDDSLSATPWCKPNSNITYIVRGSNTTGCVRYDTLNVFVTTAPNANAGPDTFVCIGNSVQLSASGGAYYSWSPAAGLNDTSVNNPLASPLVETTYRVIVANGTCRDTDYVKVSVKFPPATSAGSDKNICQGDSIQLFASGADIYQWNTSFRVSDSSIANPWVKPLFPTNYIVKGTNTFGCFTFDTVFVNVLPKVTVTASPDTGFCEGGSVQLNCTTFGINTVSWYPAYGLSATNIKNPVASPLVDTIYYVKVDNGTCSYIDSVRVSVWPFPIANAGPDLSICSGDSILINATGNGAVLWKNSTTLSDSNQLSTWAKPTSTTEYYLQVTSIHGCRSFDTIRVNVIQRPAVVASADDSICVGKSKILTATGNGTRFLWSTGDTGSQINVSPTITTTYWVRNGNLNCFGPADSVTVFVDTSLKASFIPNPTSGTVPLLVSFFNTSRGATIFDWDFGDGTTSNLESPSHIFSKEGNYKVILTVRNHLGCIDTFSFSISVRNDFSIAVPNVFTPNGDGMNDYFEVRQTGVKSINMLIFNRWGELIFKSDDLSKTWDGNNNGVQMPEGVYYYLIQVTDFSNKLYPEIKGDLSLIR